MNANMNATVTATVTAKLQQNIYIAVVKTKTQVYCNQ